MLSRGRMLLAVTFLHATVAARINVLPNLSRSLDQQQHSQEQRQHLQTKHSQPLQHQRFHIVAALDGDATKVLSSLFGTCFPFDDAESVLHAELCVLPSPTSPALLLLAPPGDVAPLSALALSDVWVAVLPEGADERVTDAMVERVLTALAQLPPSASGPRQLIVVSQQAAAAATGGMAPAEPASQSSEPPEQLQQRLWSRLQEKQALRCAAGGACPLVASLLRLHCAVLSPGLLARFSQPERAGYVLTDASRASTAGIGLSEALLLLEELVEVLDSSSSSTTTTSSSSHVGSPAGQHGSREGAGREAAASSVHGCMSLAEEGEWSALIGCARARSEASALAMAQVEGLHAQLLESRLNPPNGGDFASRLERAVARGRECFERSAKRWVSTGAYAHHYALLRETCDERVVEVAQLQLQLLQDDALATFRGELAMLMASSAEGTYKRAARRLMRRTAKAFAKAAEAASPRTALRSPDGTAVVREAAEQGLARLEAAMADEAMTHEEEAEAQPPREQDVGPPPWWKQILAQVIGVGLNLAQAYVLQHLPARHRDRLDEQAVPRGPLF